MKYKEDCYFGSSPFLFVDERSCKPFNLILIGWHVMDVVCKVLVKLVVKSEIVLNNRISL